MASRNAGPPKPKTLLEARLLNQPCRRQLDVAFPSRVRRRPLAEPGLQFGKLFNRNDWILEEAPGAAAVRVPINQHHALGTPYVANRCRDLNQARLRSGPKSLLYIGIAQVRRAAG